MTVFILHVEGRRAAPFDYFENVAEAFPLRADGEAGGFLAALAHRLPPIQCVLAVRRRQKIEPADRKISLVRPHGLVDILVAPVTGVILHTRIAAKQVQAREADHFTVLADVFLNRPHVVTAKAALDRFDAVAVTQVIDQRTTIVVSE